MRETAALLVEYGFPAIRRGRLQTLQLNLGYRCNQSCLHCHVNVDRQRGNGVFAASIRALRRLNALGYAGDDGTLCLSLVYNPQGASLPPPQHTLEQDYRRELGQRYGVRFNRLLTMANMPIGRFGSVLVSRGQFDDYMRTLRAAHLDRNLAAVMCRSTVSVDWQGDVYDCDFNQMLKLPMRLNGCARVTLAQLLEHELEGNPIRVRDHCFACTAGQGSSCGGALQ
jgi:radical SAM/Cys-rich protein